AVREDEELGAVGGRRARRDRLADADRDRVQGEVRFDRQHQDAVRGRVDERRRSAEALRLERRRLGPDRIALPATERDQSSQKQESALHGLLPSATWLASSKPVIVRASPEIRSMKVILPSGCFWAT